MRTLSSSQSHTKNNYDKQIIVIEYMHDTKLLQIQMKTTLDLNVCQSLWALTVLFNHQFVS